MEKYKKYYIRKSDIEEYSGLGEEELFSPGVEGIRGVELMNAIELSGWRGGVKLELPVSEDEYLRELNLRRKTSRVKNIEDKGPVATLGRSKNMAYGHI